MATRSGMSVQEAGKLGGIERARKYSPEQLSAQAKQAAQTVERRDPGFHAKIGSKSHGGKGARQQQGEGQNKNENANEKE